MERRAWAVGAIQRRREKTFRTMRGGGGMRASMLLAFVVLASGCVGTDPPEPPLASAGAARDEGEAPVAPPPEGATPDAPPASSQDGSPEPRAPRVMTLLGVATTEAAVGAPCPDATLDCAIGTRPRAAVLAVPEAGPQTATLVATWTPTTPLAAHLKLFLHAEEGDAPLAKGRGASPLTLEVPPEVFALSGNHHVVAFPDLPGAMVEQTVDVALTLVYA